MRVTDGKCRSDEQSVFAREWAGIEKGCLVNKLDAFLGFSSTQVVMTLSEYDDYIERQVSRSNSRSNDDNKSNDWGS